MAGRKIDKMPGFIEAPETPLSRTELEWLKANDTHAYNAWLKANFPFSSMDSRNYMFYEMPKKIKCPDCKGTGETILFMLRETCKTCNGTGEVTK